MEFSKKRGSIMIIKSCFINGDHEVKPFQSFVLFRSRDLLLRELSLFHCQKILRLL